MTSAHRPLAALAVQHWKLCADFERELGFASPDRVAPGLAQLRFSRQRLGAALHAEGLSLATYDGRPWSADLPPSPVNAEEIADPDAAVVEATIEPTIIAAEGVLHPGKVVLKDAA